MNGASSQEHAEVDIGTRCYGGVACHAPTHDYDRWEEGLACSNHPLTQTGLDGLFHVSTVEGTVGMARRWVVRDLMGVCLAEGRSGTEREGNEHDSHVIVLMANETERAAADDSHMIPDARHYGRPLAAVVAAAALDDGVECSCGPGEPDWNSPSLEADSLGRGAVGDRQPLALVAGAKELGGSRQ